MPVTVANPTAGVLPIAVKIGECRGGALAATPLPSGVTVVAPASGVLPILGAVVMGSVQGGAFVQELPS